MLGWPNIKSQIESETAKVAVKALHNEAPDYLLGLLCRLSDVQNRSLLNSNTDQRMPLLRMSSVQKSFELTRACIWSKLGNEARRASKFLAFRYNHENWSLQ